MNLEKISKNLLFDFKIEIAPWLRHERANMNPVRTPSDDKTFSKQEW
jgi:hypothetical protein